MRGKRKKAPYGLFPSTYHTYLTIFVIAVSDPVWQIPSQIRNWGKKKKRVAGLLFFFFLFFSSRALRGGIIKGGFFCLIFNNLHMSLLCGK